MASGEQEKAGETRLTADDTEGAEEERTAIRKKCTPYPLFLRMYGNDWTYGHISWMYGNSWT